MNDTDLRMASKVYPTVSLSQVIQDLQTEAKPIPTEALLPQIRSLLQSEVTHPLIAEFFQACVPYFERDDRLSELVDLMVDEANQFHQLSQTDRALYLAKLAAQIAPDDPLVCNAMTVFLQNGGGTGFTESITWAEKWLAKVDDLANQVIASHFLLSGLMQSCATWARAEEVYRIHKALLAKIPAFAASYQPPSSNSGSAFRVDRLPRLLGFGMFLHYFEDAPRENRSIRNQIAEVCQERYRFSVQDQLSYSPTTSRKSSTLRSTKRLKIGYLSGCLRQHSVGWLARWLLHHQDQEQFEVHLYATVKSDDVLQHSFAAAYGDRFHLLLTDPPAIAKQIHQDEIDILVELDSLTFFTACAVAALKPAPIQVSWLGFDASGLPAIDYYIADPYVLPEDAQSYYPEKIWRLPQTYIAVDGFEVGTPSLRREQLNIPEDAIVYLCCQSGLKRNPDNIRTQMQILRAVPNSYCLIKARWADPVLMQAFFGELAEVEGVSRDRLRFLPDEPSESTHRANLAIADVVLDTYPYNGATTTLETLWMGVPIVTQVGEQFAARNSYTMMMNVGVTEGIAWSQTEYLEWGIRLGTDAALRQNIAYRLRQSRHTSPLWNGRQFARDVEQAYKQMWQQYCEG